MATIAMALAISWAMATSMRWGATKRAMARTAMVMAMVTGWRVTTRAMVRVEREIVLSTKRMRARAEKATVGATKMARKRATTWVIPTATRVVAGK